VDENAVMKAVEEAGEVRTAMAKLKVRQLLLVKRTFTPEQIELARKRMRQHMMRARDAQQERRRRDRPGRGRRDAAPEGEPPGGKPR